MKIVVLDGYTLNPGDITWDALKKQGNTTILDRTENTTEKVVEAIGDAEIILTNKTIISKEILAKVPALKYIGVLATGYNVVDVEAAKAQNIVVANIPAYSTPSVAQLVFALLLEMCHQVGSHNQAVKSGEWVNSEDFCFWNHPLIELAGKTMGIVGYGRIGKATAKIAEAFGLKVLVYSRTQYPELVEQGVNYVSLDELLAKSDIVSLHCPQTSETTGLINKTTIGKMKDGAMLINTGRGALINEQDLFDALETGKLAGAAVDVLSTEPPLNDNPLLKAKNCIITPHIAWAPKESRQRLMDIAVSNVKAFVEGKPVNVVF